MRIVIVGDGKVGYALTGQLALEDHDVVVIDSKKDVLQEAETDFDVKVVHGNGVSKDTQEEADVEDSDLLIAATSADEINLLCCIIGRKLGCPHTIARVRNPEYSQELFFLKDELGLSMMVNPEWSCAREIFRLLQFPSFLQLDSFAKGRVEIVEIELREGNPLIGKLLTDFERVVKVSALICAVRRGESVLIPSGATRLEERDRISVTARAADLARLVRNLELGNRRIRNVMIIGGSNIARYLTEELLAAGVSVKLIEKSEARCNQFAERFPKATVIMGDGTNRKVLDSEGLERTDALVTLTDMDEENLIVSMYGEYAGVPKVITKINRTEYGEIFADKGIGLVVSPKELVTSEITQYVRAMQNKTGGAVVAMHRIVDGRMEALEFRATAQTLHTGETLAQMPVKPNVLIACINRLGTILIPKGNDTILPGDTVIVVTLASMIIRDLNDIFEDAPRGGSRS